jgi:hypothetical protein
MAPRPPPHPLLSLCCCRRPLRARLPCCCRPAPCFPHPSLLRPHGRRSMLASGLQPQTPSLKLLSALDRSGLPAVGSGRPTAGSAVHAGMQPLTTVGVRSRSRASSRHHRFLWVAVTHPVASSRRADWCFSGGGLCRHRAVGRQGLIDVPRSWACAGVPLIAIQAPLRSLVDGSRRALVGSTPLVVVVPVRWVLRPP